MKVVIDTSWKQTVCETGTELLPGVENEVSEEEGRRLIAAGICRAAGAELVGRRAKRDLTEGVTNG